MLALPPGDLDVAVDGVTGAAFAERLRASSTAGNVSFAVVASNPAQSKHLETAVLQWRGHRVDLCHLRTELYTGHSRIPSAGFGTLVQDAMRRDCTINALYWNVDARALEDPSERGVDDLCQGLIRTPAAPALTLEEDPLRLLRLLRFAAALDFTVDPALWRAMCEPSVLDALARKVSGERIQIELDKMLLLPRAGYERAVHSVSAIPGLWNVVLCRSASPTKPLLSEAAEATVPNAELLVAARTAALVLGTSDAVTWAESRQRVWSNQRRASVVGLLHGVARLAHAAEPGQVGMWVRQLGPEQWRTAMILAGRAADEHWNERAFLDPLVPGDAVAARYGLRGRDIGGALHTLLQWQMTAPREALTVRDALLYLDQHQVRQQAV